jgi:hypothetical protein
MTHSETRIGRVPPQHAISPKTLRSYSAITEFSPGGRLPPDAESTGVHRRGATPKKTAAARGLAETEKPMMGDAKACVANSTYGVGVL